ncbi:MAG TPA: hypothetical protein VFA29_09540 [Candidatus Baltobacteraceae bacterium]|nr:hypothetical protein [Candidatus Baltobacteraceae bacterium]
MNIKSLFTAVAFAAALSAGATTFVSAGPSRQILARAALGTGTVTLWRAGSHFGATIDVAALSSLPDRETRVDLPATAIAPFRLVEIDWHPHGHEPKGVYDVPHFDAHFYTIEQSERNAIEGSPPGVAPRPAGDLVPQGYVSDGSVVPQMGMHYVPAAAPELHGKPFMATEIFGYNGSGKLIFVEAMFSRRFTDARGSFSSPVPHPAGVKVPLPDSMSVSRNPQTGGYDIALSK